MAAFMKTPGLDYRLKVLLLVSGLLLPCLQPAEGFAAGFGSLAGLVSDNKGVPLMGATVLVVGPTAFATEASAQTSERMLTDARGRFTIAHLLPGWYSLKVSSPTRLPVMRNGVRVEAGETAIATFVLTDVFAPIRFQVPTTTVSSWGDDWKWVLRTSSSTRPILRMRQQPEPKQVASKGDKIPLPRSRRFIGVVPGSTLHDPLAEDFGMSSVVAYEQPRSVDSDVLATASFAPAGFGATSLGTAIVRNQLQDDPQEFGVVFHQFNLLPGQNVPSGAGANGIGQARGLVATYSETRLLSPSVSVTTGMDISYLSAIDSVFAAQPRVEIEYQASSKTVLSAQYGSSRENGDTSIDRLSMLNAFPQITQRDGRLAMEQLNHSELAVNHRIGNSARVQVAAYAEMRARTSGSANAFLLAADMRARTSGSANAFLLAAEMRARTSGSAHAFLRAADMRARTSGSANAFLLAAEMRARTSGSAHAFLLAADMRARTSGSAHAFLLAAEMRARTSGSANAFLRAAEMRARTSGSANAFLLAADMRARTSGSANAFLLAADMRARTSGSAHAFLRAADMRARTSGSAHAFLRAADMRARTSGSANAFLLAADMRARTSGSANAFLLAADMRARTSGSAHAFLLAADMRARTSGSANAFLRAADMRARTSGSAHAFLRAADMRARTSGSANAFLLAADMRARASELVKRRRCASERLFSIQSLLNRRRTAPAANCA